MTRIEKRDAVGSEGSNMRSLDKFRGCLIGGAAGDALGYAVEFLGYDDIIAKYGRRGITEYDLKDGVAEISDDTQMSLFTATGLLFGTTRGKMRGIMGSYPSYINGSYLDWLKTQCECYPLKKEFHYSWLVNIPEMFSSRAPGNTCMSALARGGNGTIEEPINNSKGCGGIMRIAPIGIYFNDRNYVIENIDMIGAETAALTHGHELGYIPAAALVHIIHQITEKEGETIQTAVLDSLEMMKKLFLNARHMGEFIALIEKAVELAGKNMPDIDAITQLGEGWVAEETLAIAVYCALKYSEDFDKGIIAAVNHSGDSDSTGAVTGNILGAYLGYDAINAKWKYNLELNKIIREISDDLYYDCQMNEYSHDVNNKWIAKYIDMNYIVV